MTTEHLLLDPRFDADPTYWPQLRHRAGLRADWAWDVLAVQAWCARTPQYISVFRDRGVPTGVAASARIGTPTRRHRFAGTGRGGRIGGLDVRSPGSSALPGWWFADAGGAGELLERYVPAMRRELGAGVRGLLLRQIDAADVSHVDCRWRIVRRTEDAAEIPIAGFGSVEDWLATLRKKRRHNLRRISQRVAEDADLEVTVGPLSPSDAVESAIVLRHNEERHRDVPIVPLPQFVGYLERLFDRSDVVAVRYRHTATGTQPPAHGSVSVCSTTTRRAHSSGPGPGCPGAGRPTGPVLPLLRRVRPVGDRGRPGRAAAGQEDGGDEADPRRHADSAVRRGDPVALTERREIRSRVRHVPARLAVVTPEEMYPLVRERFCALVSGLDDAALATPVPATPGWTVRDVLGHVAGVCADVGSGNTEGAVTPEWTAAQVECRRRLTVAQVCER